MFRGTLSYRAVSLPLNNGGVVEECCRVRKRVGPVLEPGGNRQRQFAIPGHDHEGDLSAGRVRLQEVPGEASPAATGPLICPMMDLDKLIMVVPLQGNYASLRAFLQAVEDSEKFLLVERVALAEARQGGVMLELNITLATYFDAPAGGNGRKV